jgi:ribosomal protein S18 acetylase RimI-like enzyme
MTEPDGVMGVAPEVVAGMQRLALDTRALLGARAQWHVGDLAWGLRRRGGRELDWRIRLRSEGDRVVAWSWLQGEGGRLEYDVHPQHVHLLDELLAEPAASSAFAFEDDRERRAAVERHGFREPGEAMHFLVRDLTRPPDQAELPPGFRCRTVDDADLTERVDVHRDVWAPSDLTESSYAGVRMQWPYRASLDCVVEAPDGRFVAYALLWPDDEHGVGELEPVGVRDEFRRRGLGAAVCSYALRRWHEQGGRQAIVYCRTEAARALYKSLGFRVHTTLREYTRP